MLTRPGRCREESQQTFWTDVLWRRSPASDSCRRGCSQWSCSGGISFPFLQVFIRELISNASDALEKLRHKLVSEGQTLPEMEIHLQTDSEKGTITIQVPLPCVLTRLEPPVLATARASPHWDGETGLPLCPVSRLLVTSWPSLLFAYYI